MTNLQLSLFNFGIRGKQQDNISNNKLLDDELDVCNDIVEHGGGSGRESFCGGEGVSLVQYLTQFFSLP